MKLLIRIASLILTVVTLGAAAGISADKAEVPIHFAVIGDRTGGHTEGVYGEVLQEIIRLRPEFIMTVGDMIEGYTEDTIQMISEWDEYMGIIDGVPIPIHHTPGNHDITTDAMKDMYHRYIGESYYSFDHRGVHFVVFDNAAGWGGDPPPLSNEQYEWLVADLESQPKDKMVLLFCHKPFWFKILPWGLPHRLHGLFVRTGVDAVISGHFHRYFSTDYDGVLYASIGSSGGGMRPDAGGLGYQFVWVTVSHDSVWLSSIHKGSVLPTDHMTANDLHLSFAMERLTLSQPTPIDIPEEVGATASVEIVVRNLSMTVALEDTLRWTVPDGWQVSPSDVAILIGPGAQESVSFEVIRTGELYPLPSVALTVPLRAERKLGVTRDLRLGRSVSCVTAIATPQIDGVLDESIWMDPVTDLYSGDYESSKVDSTEFYFAADSMNLYLAAKCFETVPDSIIANVTERDGAIYGEDCVGYFLAPPFDGDSVFQIYVNPKGVVFDQSIAFVGGTYSTSRDFDGDYEIATTVTNGYWTMEMRIPFATLNGAAIEAKDWGVNFRRKQKRLGASAQWLTPIDYDPMTFGRLLLPGK